MANLKFYSTLIDLVKEHPILFNVHLKEYRNRRQKEKIWIEMLDRVRKIGFNVPDIQTLEGKWKLLRDRFHRLYRTILDKPPGAITNIKWPYFEQLFFLGLNNLSKRRRRNIEDVSLTITPSASSFTATPSNEIKKATQRDHENSNSVSDMSDEESPGITWPGRKSSSCEVGVDVIKTLTSKRADGPSNETKNATLLDHEYSNSVCDIEVTPGHRWPGGKKGGREKADGVEVDLEKAITSATAVIADLRQRQPEYSANPCKTEIRAFAEYITSSLQTLDNDTLTTTMEAITQITFSAKRHAANLAVQNPSINCNNGQRCHFENVVQLLVGRCDSQCLFQE